MTRLTKAQKLEQKRLLEEQNLIVDQTTDLSHDQILDKLNAIDTSKIKVKEKKNKDKRSKDDMYHYSHLFQSYFELDYSTIDTDTFKIKGQRIRTKVRNKRNAFASNIIHYKNENDFKSLEKEVKDFIKFYKKTFVLNDYSLKSISSNNRDEDTKIKLESMLSIIQILK